MQVGREREVYRQAGWKVERRTERQAGRKECR